MVSEVKIQLDKERTLRFDFNALRTYEKATGLNMLRTNVLQNLNLDDLTTLLWAALVHEDKSLTVDNVGAMLALDDATRVFDALAQALGAAMPKPEEAAESATDPTPAKKK